MVFIPIKGMASWRRNNVWMRWSWAFICSCSSWLRILPGRGWEERQEKKWCQNWSKAFFSSRNRIMHFLHEDVLLSISHKLHIGISCNVLKQVSTASSVLLYWNLTSPFHNQAFSGIWIKSNRCKVFEWWVDGIQTCTLDRMAFSNSLYASHTGSPLVTWSPTAVTALSKMDRTMSIPPGDPMPPIEYRAYASQISGPGYKDKE